MVNESCPSDVPSPCVDHENRIKQVQTVLGKYSRSSDFIYDAVRATTAIGSFKVNTVPDMDFLCSRAVIIAASISLSKKGALVGIMIGREEYSPAVERKYKCANMVTVLDHKGRPLAPQWSALLAFLLNGLHTKTQFDREVFIPHLINVCEGHYCLTEDVSAASNGKSDSGTTQIKTGGQTCPSKPSSSELVVAFDGKVPKREQLHCMRVIEEIAHAMLMNVHDAGDMTIPLLSTYVRLTFKKNGANRKPQSRLQEFMLGKCPATTTLDKPSEIIDKHIHSISQTFSKLVILYCQLQYAKRSKSPLDNAATDKKKFQGSTWGGLFTGYDFSWLSHFAEKAIGLTHSILNPNTQATTDDEYIMQLESLNLEPDIRQKMAARFGSAVVDASYGFIGIVFIKLMKSLRSSLFVNDKSIIAK